MIGDREILASQAIEAIRDGRQPTVEQWEAVIEVERLLAMRMCKLQVEALIAAGWTFEVPEHDLDTWQWAWRRPPRRPGKPGRRFASTGQAYNALMREKGEHGDADR